MAALICIFSLIKRDLFRTLTKFGTLEFQTQQLIRFRQGHRRVR